MLLLYRLVDSGDHWHATLAKHLTGDFDMKPVARDMSIFFRCTRVLASYIFDTLECIERSFPELN